MKRILLTILCTGAIAPAFGQTVFAQNLPGFLSAISGTQNIVDFDVFSDESNLNDDSFSTIRFRSTTSSLSVVKASETFTPAGVFNDAPNPASNVLSATTGQMVLSPGGKRLGPGPDPAVENDGVEILFAEPVSFFGFDHLSQSADGGGFTNIVVEGPGGTIYSGSIPIQNLGGGGAPAGNDFWGIVASDAIITRVVITELDNNSQFPDANIGYDTIRYGAVPEPATMIGLGAGVAFLTRRKKK